MVQNQVSKIDRILVVDDSTDNLFLIQATLEGEGYDICLAEDGKTALSKVVEFKPDLILLDVMMPEMDGYEVTTRIRQNTKLPYIPILLITADERSSVVKGLDFGADDFIRKPMDVDELMARVRSLLRLKHSIDDREHMALQREDFVSRLTHDLRIPLVAADRMLSLFQQEAFGSISAEMREAVDSMTRSNKNLLQMVNTLLEVYRHDSGYKTLNFCTCNLTDVVQEVAKQLTPLASERGLDLTVEVMQSLDNLDSDNVDSDNADMGRKQMIAVSGDRLELHRVLTNLIGNAIKFTDSGTITVRLIKSSTANPLSDQPAQGWVTVEIQDTGAGIPPSEQSTLFERFRAGGHKRSGSGLGLYLSRRIIESHQGTIEVSSELGKGSVFTIRLPALKA
jgi:two-component system, sensor histidine kinase and response regulator